MITTILAMVKIIILGTVVEEAGNGRKNPQTRLNRIFQKHRNRVTPTHANDPCDPHSQTIT